jgi:hypothetical protein
MGIKLLRHEIFANIIEQDDLFSSITLLSVDSDWAVMEMRGTRIRVNTSKLPYKPTVNDCFVAIDRAYANRCKWQRSKPASGQHYTEKTAVYAAHQTTN